MNAPLQDSLGRPKRYDKYDGTTEMVVGIMALGFALLGSRQAVLPENSIWRHGFADMLLFYAGVLLMLGLMHWVPQAIKQRITWPRTGYVAYHFGGSRTETKKSFWTVIAATAVFSGALGAGVAYLMRSPHSGSTDQLGGLGRRPDWISLLWMGAAAIYVASYAWFIYHTGREYPWKWLVLLFMALGLLAIALIAPGEFVTMGRPMLLFIGLTWIGSGVTTLYLYIRHTQPPIPEAE